MLPTAASVFFRRDVVFGNFFGGLGGQLQLRRTHACRTLHGNASAPLCASRRCSIRPRDTEEFYAVGAPITKDEEPRLNIRVEHLAHQAPQPPVNEPPIDVAGHEKHASRS